MIITRDQTVRYDLTSYTKSPSSVKCGGMKKIMPGIAAIQNSPHTTSWQQLPSYPGTTRLDNTSLDHGYRFPTLQSPVSSTMCITPLNSTPSPTSSLDKPQEERRTSAYDCSSDGFLNRQKKRRSAKGPNFRDRFHFHNVDFVAPHHGSKQAQHKHRSMSISPDNDPRKQDRSLSHTTNVQKLAKSVEWPLRLVLD